MEYVWLSAPSTNKEGFYLVSASMNIPEMNKGYVNFQVNVEMEYSKVNRSVMIQIWFMVMDVMNFAIIRPHLTRSLKSKHSKFLKYKSSDKF